LSTSEATRRTGSRIRVAILDDHGLVVDGLSARLAEDSLGIDVVIAEQQWIELIAHPEFPVDVVVIGFHLDDSAQISRKITALGVSCAVVVMSRHSDSASVNVAFQAGALGFVPKTDSAEELILAIRAAAEGERYLSVALQLALAQFASAPQVSLGKQELRSLVLYAGGRSMKEVAVDMETTEETVKSYVKRARRKYRHIGVDLGTRVLLRNHAVREGWIAPD
jgi:DNA-binding NarL/FixJ family response regulator